MSNIESSSNTNRNEQHGVYNVHMNSQEDTHIAQILHDDFERECIHVVGGHEEDMDGSVTEHGILLDQLLRVT